MEDSIKQADRYRIGGNIVRSRVCFSEDEKTFFCCAGSVVKTYNVATGALLGVLEGHTARVSCILINPNNSLQLYTTSHDGTIKLWDYIEGICLQTYNMKAPILHAVIGINYIYVSVSPDHYSRLLTKGQSSFMTKENKLRSVSRVMSVALNLKTHNGTPLLSLPDCTAMSISTDRHYLSVIYDNYLHIYNLTTQQEITITHTCNLTTLKFHPKLPMLATGDEKGRILLWSNYTASFNTEPFITPPCTSLQWHAHSVTALEFSEDGSYLLSGGSEAVLVYWNLETNQKQFLPRFGDTILHITTSYKGSLYAVACADNAVRMVNAYNNKVIHIIQGLQYATAYLQYTSDSKVQKILNEQILTSVPRAIRYGSIAPSQRMERLEHNLAMTSNIDITGDGDLETKLEEAVILKATKNTDMPCITHLPYSNHVVLSGKPGVLQVYDPVTDQHVGNITVVDRNYLSKEDFTETNPEVSVNHVCFSDDAKWLVTTDTFSEGSQLNKTFLKVWNLNSSGSGTGMSGNISDVLNNGYTLNTRTQHEGDVTSVRFHPTKPMFVTTCSDQTFRVWTLKTKTVYNARTATSHGMHLPSDQENTTEHISWVCSTTGQYRNSPVTTASFSQDGSVLAVAFGSVVTLWSIRDDDVVLQTTLIHPPPLSPIRWLYFINGTTFLLAVTHTSFYIWDILTCTVHWSYHMQTAAVTVHPTLPYIAALVVLPSTPDVVSASNDKVSKPAKRCALLVFHAESSNPVSVRDASDAKFLKQKTNRRDASRAEYTAEINDKKKKQEEHEYNIFHSTSVYSASLSFMPPISQNNTLPSISTTGLPIDACSMMYLNRSRELIRLPNVLQDTSDLKILSDAALNERMSMMKPGNNAQLPPVFSMMYNNTSLAAKTTSDINPVAVTTQGKSSRKRTLHPNISSFVNAQAHTVGSLALSYESYMDAFLEKK